MSLAQRFKSILISLGMLLGALVLMLFPEDGCYFIAILLAFALLLRGVRMLIYYFSMARHMVGGLTMLLIGVFLLDFGVFTMTIIDEPRIFVILYLAGWHGFAGLVGALRAFEAKRYKAPSWRLKAVSGIVNVLIAAACFVFMQRREILVYIYTAGLIYSACMNIISALRSSEIVYIQ